MSLAGEMTDGKPAAPGSGELISRAESLIPLLRANASLADRLAPPAGLASAKDPAAGDENRAG
jgi:hypothetical protein